MEQHSSCLLCTSMVLVMFYVLYIYAVDNTVDIIRVPRLPNKINDRGSFPAPFTTAYPSAYFRTISFCAFSSKTKFITLDFLFLVIDLADIFFAVLRFFFHRLLKTDGFIFLTLFSTTTECTPNTPNHPCYFKVICDK